MSGSTTMESIGCKRKAYLACKTTGQKSRLRARIAGTSGIALRRNVLRHLARIKRKLEAYHRGVSAGTLTGPRVGGLES